MADPVDQLIEQLDPATPDPTPTPAPDGVSKAEYERLEAELRRTQGEIADLRVAAINNQVPPAPERTDSNAEFYADPDKFARAAARAEMAPVAAQMNETLVSLLIENYKNSKQSDPFYNVVVGSFEKELAPMRGQIGYMPRENVINLFNKIWLAAVGEYSSNTLAKRKAEAPANLGGGGGSPGGPKGKRHLRELDPAAYNSAMNAGLSEEEMQAIADEIEGNE